MDRDGDKPPSYKTVDSILERIGLKQQSQKPTDDPKRRRAVEELVDEVTRFDDSGQVWVRILKDVTFVTARALQDAFDLYRSQGFLHIRMDMSLVGFIDSAGVGLLAATQQGLAKTGGSLYILNPQGALTSILKIVRLGQLIPIQQKSLPEPDSSPVLEEPEEDAGMDAALRAAQSGRDDRGR
jgi:anti-anti-sigma factor